MELLKLSPIFKAQVVKRPSLTCKTPYVADIQVDNNDVCLGHTPALGCCGLCENGCVVYVTPSPNPSNKCSYTIQLSHFYDAERDKMSIVGINPNLAEKLVESMLSKNLFSQLDVWEFGSQKTYGNSRFDFSGNTKDGTHFILEVKNVPLADYVDCTAKERKKINTSHYEFGDKIAYFPDGYRKKVTDTVSPRALKHVTELAEMKIQHPEMRCILCFVTQRLDVSSFQPSNIDPIYQTAILDAVSKGVELIALQVGWSENGIATLITDTLPINVPTFIIPKA